MESVKEETVKRRKEAGFIDRYMQGAGLDIGSKGYNGQFDEVGSTPFKNATGVDLDYPGYDGIALPFDTESQDFVYSSHMLEHVPTENLPNVLQEQHRVVKTEGYIIIAVPHMYLYERKVNLPSTWNRDHKRFYTPASLMREVEFCLRPNSYRLRHLQDCDTNYNYDLGPSDSHPVGEYQLECVLQKIKPPNWSIV